MSSMSGCLGIVFFSGHSKMNTSNQPLSIFLNNYAPVSDITAEYGRNFDYVSLGGREVRDELRDIRNKLQYDDRMWDLFYGGRGGRYLRNNPGFVPYHRRLHEPGSLSTEERAEILRLWDEWERNALPRRGVRRRGVPTVPTPGSREWLIGRRNDLRRSIGSLPPQTPEQEMLQLRRNLSGVNKSLHASSIPRGTPQRTQQKRRYTVKSKNRLKYKRK